MRQRMVATGAAEQLGGSSWPEDKEAVLRRMWDAKFSASDIARAFHDGTTRNAVIGKIHRLGLQRRTQAEIAAALSKNFAAVNEQRRIKSRQLGGPNLRRPSLIAKPGPR